MTGTTSHRIASPTAPRAPAEAAGKTSARAVGSAWEPDDFDLLPDPVPPAGYWEEREEPDPLERTEGRIPGPWWRDRRQDRRQDRRRPRHETANPPEAADYLP